MDNPSLITPGALYIVATPMGNLQDITYRAVAILKAVDVIFAEDTRHSRHLLENYGIKTPCFSYHAHNEAKRAGEIVGQLGAGRSIAIISDAGTPLVRDPGLFAVEAALEAGKKVVPVPGPCSAIAALSAAGFSGEKFVFEGFLPAKLGEREKVLTAFQKETRPAIFYLSPHRLLAELASFIAVFGKDRAATLAKELTKRHEKLLKGSLQSLLEWVLADPRHQKGEFVLVLGGQVAEATMEDTFTFESLALLQKLMAHLPLKQAVALQAALTGEKKNTLYKAALACERKP